MTQMLLTIMNHILQFSGSLLFHGEVYIGGGEAVSDLPGKNVEFQLFSLPSTKSNKPVNSIFYLHIWAPVPGNKAP